MFIKNFLKKVILAAGLMSMSLGFVCPNPIYAEAEIKIVKNVTEEYGWSYDESKTDVKQKTLEKAMRKALEMACTILTSISEEQDFKLIKDEVISATEGLVETLGNPKYEMDEEKRICKVTINARVKYDEDAIKRLIKEIKKRREEEQKDPINKNDALPFIDKDKRKHYYQIVDKGLDWHAAKKYCEDHGCHLVTIGSKEEQKFIEELLRNQGNRNCYWIGGENIGKRSYWIDGTSFNYTNWANGQPDSPQERALMIYKNQNKRAPLHTLGTWNDLRSDGTFPNENDFFGLDHFGFICEWDS